MHAKYYTYIIHIPGLEEAKAQRHSIIYLSRKKKRDGGWEFFFKKKGTFRQYEADKNDFLFSLSKLSYLGT